MPLIQNNLIPLVLDATWFSKMIAKFKKEITLKHLMIFSLFCFLSFVNSPGYATTQIDPQNIPQKCAESFTELQHARTLREANSDFPSLKMIAAKREAVFVACLNGAERPTTELMDYDINQPDLVVWDK